MRSCCTTLRTAVAGARSATSAQAPCRSTKRSSASATIHISWTCTRPTVEPLQRIDAKQECCSLETTDPRLHRDFFHQGGEQPDLRLLAPGCDLFRPDPIRARHRLGG